jgi:hypothetical protein
MASIELGQPEGAQPSGAQPLIPGGSSTPPLAFHFETRFKADRSTQYTSNVQTITGLSDPTESVVVNGEQSLNGGDFTSSPVTLDDGDTLQLRQISSALASTQNVTTATIEGVVGSFVTITEAAEEVRTSFRRRAFVPWRRRAA